jgi:hypothetical protein
MFVPFCSTTIQELNYIQEILCFSTLMNYFNNKNFQQILEKIIELSALPFKEVEAAGKTKLQKTKRINDIRAFRRKHTGLAKELLKDIKYDAEIIVASKSGNKTRGILKGSFPKGDKILLKVGDKYKEVNCSRVAKIQLARQGIAAKLLEGIKDGSKISIISRRGNERKVVLVGTSPKDGSLIFIKENGIDKVVNAYQVREIKKIR